MMWSIPRPDPGAATEYRRPNGWGVSAQNGALLPYGRLPRLLMLWMYTQRERTGQGSLDLVYELSDYLLELELPETPELAEQAHRLFACRLHMGERVVPVTEASMTQWVDEADPFREVAPLHAAQAELSEELYDAMRGWGGAGVPAHPALGATLALRTRRVSVGDVPPHARARRGAARALPGGALPRARRASLGPAQPDRAARVRARVLRRPHPRRTAPKGAETPEGGRSPSD